MEHENVIVVGFDSDSKAYQALGVLTQLDAEGRIDLRAVAIIRRAADGFVSVVEEGSDAPGTGFVSGGLVGALVGLLGGPLGMLLGWTFGAVMGTATGITREGDAGYLLAQAGKAIGRGATGLVAEVREATVDPIDGEMGRLGGVIVRWPRAEAMREVEVMAAAERAATAEANRVIHEHRQAGSEGLASEVAELKGQGEKPA
ncbi:MAG: DUF1269 domain-containing protein [Propionibacteriaceae bacterium]|nr:DUF1269 domain-containing protein [Propionibacteriaceae bacterium]